MSKVSEVKVIEPDCYNPAKRRLVGLMLESSSFFIRRNKELKQECNAEEEHPNYLAYVVLAHLDKNLSAQELETLRQTFVGMPIEFETESHKLVLATGS